MVEQMVEQTVAEVMTPGAVSVSGDTPVEKVAERMRSEHIGDVLITDGEFCRGMITDRDLVVRVLAERRDPRSTTAAEICSERLTIIHPEESVNRAIQMMRDSAVRRLPVCDQSGRPLGVVSLGDLAMSRDPHSALADISAAPPTD